MRPLVHTLLRVRVLPLLLLFVLLSSLLLCAVGETVCVEPDSVVSSLDARFCCPKDDEIYGRYRLDVNSVNAAGTAAYCRSCYTTEPTFDDCLRFAGGENVCCAGTHSQ